MQEKRTVRRYRLSLPAIFSWVDGEKHTCGGFTRDVSTNGAFVLCSEPVPANTVVEMEILLPTSGELPGTAVRAKAQVLRNKAIGFAVAGQFGQPELPDSLASRLCNSQQSQPVFNTRAVADSGTVEGPAEPTER